MDPATFAAGFLTGILVAVLLDDVVFPFVIPLWARMARRTGHVR